MEQTTPVKPLASTARPVASLQDMLETWKTLATGGLSSPGMNRADKVNAHRNAAQDLQNKVESSPFVGGSSKPHLGLPNNFAELTDLMVEASLLPRPDALLRERFGTATSNSNNSNPTIPPFGGKFRNIEALQKTSFFMECLAREPDQKWNQIHWTDSVDQAMSLAQRFQKPIFIEMVVGRMGQKDSKVC